MKYLAKIEHKQRVTINYLDDLLAKLPSGGRLPGIRTMIAQSGVGRTLLEKRLQYLVDENFLEVKYRQGYYKKQFSTVPKVLYLHEAFYPARHPGFNDILFSAVREIAQQRGFELLLVKTSDMDEAELLKLLKNSSAEMVFLGGQKDASRAAFVRKHVRYCMEVLPRHAVTQGAELRNGSATPLQMDYLFQRKYSRIAYIHQVENWNSTPTQLMRLLDYYRIMSEKNLMVYPEWVFQYTYEWETFNRSMYKMMNSPHIPEVVIVPGCCMEHFYRFCANNGITAGSELAVIGNEDLSPELSPRPTTVTNYPAEIARQMWKIMDSLVQGTELHEETLLRIVTGETVPVRQ